MLDVLLALLPALAAVGVGVLSILREAMKPRSRTQAQFSLKRLARIASELDSYGQIILALTVVVGIFGVWSAIQQLQDAATSADRLQKLKDQLGFVQSESQRQIEMAAESAAQQRLNLEAILAGQHGPAYGIVELQLRTGIPPYNVPFTRLGAPQRAALLWAVTTTQTWQSFLAFHPIFGFVSTEAPHPIEFEMGLGAWKDGPTSSTFSGRWEAYASIDNRSVEKGDPHEHLLPRASVHQIDSNRLVFRLKRQSDQNVLALWKGPGSTAFFMNTTIHLLKQDDRGKLPEIEHLAKDMIAAVIGYYTVVGDRCKKVVLGFQSVSSGTSSKSSQLRLQFGGPDSVSFEDVVCPSYVVNPTR